MVTNHWYSTQPFLAWVFNHYFYAGQHYAWMASPFYPYKLENPRSSRPMDIYRDYYEPWKEQDLFSDFLHQKRLNLANGVEANRKLLTLRNMRRLKSICRIIDSQFLYPIVYRVDINPLDPSRLIRAGSGLVGSQEYLIESLEEHEFDIIFFDASIEGLDSVFETLWTGRLSTSEALDLLESRC
jgi:hypothetical protein